MNEQPPSPPDTPAPRRAAPRLRNQWLILFIALVFTAGLLLSGAGRPLFERLYHPAALLIVVLLIVQYILLKGRDRSRMYKIEAEQVRRKRAEDQEFLAECERSLAELEQRAAADPALQEEITALRERLARRL